MVFNLIVIASLACICALGTFYKHISFGWGLGDFFGYAFMYLTLLAHIVLLILLKDKSNITLNLLAITFFVLTILICLKATIWRGPEYRWNGRLFYSNHADEDK